MRKRLLFILFICAAVEALPQSGNARLDSLFNRYAVLHGVHAGDVPHTAAITDSSAKEKCGFPMLAELINGYDNLSAEQKKTFNIIQANPQSQKTLISPGGFFRINYDTTGTEIPNYDPLLTVHQNAMLAAIAFDSSYAYEVDYLGYPPPPLNAPYYDVYLKNMNPYYGATSTNGEIGGNKYYTYIEVDNEFADFYTKGEKALQVTAAHEFHHAIQIGVYAFPEDADIFFAELTSTSMEEFVYDDCNDYYNYLPSYFYNPDRNFVKNTGYNLCIWNLYLQQKYGEAGFDIIKRQWDEMAKGKRAMDAIQESLLAVSSSFQEEYAEFSVWNYFTKHRAIAGRYYEEGANYPLIKPMHVTATIPNSVTMRFANPLSANYIYFDTRQDLANDTLAAIITNSDIAKGIGSGATADIIYSLSNYNYDGVDLKVSASLNTAGAAYWMASYIYNNTPYIPEILVETNLDYPFPNPFKYSYSAVGTEISIPIKNKKLDKANLNIYSVSGALVYRASKQINSFGGTFIIKWNGLNNDNEKLPEGIYFYAAECDGDIYKGKIAIFNE